MEDDHDIISTLRRQYEELTPSQKRIAEAIVDDPQFVAFATAEKVAERLAVAPATVVRFAYKVGFSGYPELQQQVRILVRSQIRGTSSTDAGDEDLTQHLGGSGQSESLLQDLDNLRDTISGLSADRLDSAIEVLAAARTVFVVGGYAAGALAAYAAVTLERIRGQAHLLDTASGRHLPALLEGSSDDALLAIGFEPYSADTVQVLDLAAQRGLRVVGITDTPISPVGQRVGIVLPTRVTGLGPHNSLVAPMAVLNVLLNGVTAALPDSIERHSRVLRSMDEWGFFVSPDPGR